MEPVLFTANRAGAMLLESLFAKGVRPSVVTYAKGFQRTGLAEDFSGYADKFPITFISRNSYADCPCLKEITKGRLPVCIDWTKDFFNGADFNILYAHPSLLPMYRGYSAVTEQFMRGVNFSGATFYLRTDQIDAGDIVFQQKIPIGFNDYPEDFYEKYVSVCAGFIEHICKYGTDKFLPVPQDADRAFYLQRKRSKDALIDFNRDAFSLYNHIRAFSRPFFGAYFYHNGKKITVWRAYTEKWQGDYGEPGTVLKNTEGYVEIACGSGTIIFTEFSPSTEFLQNT